VISSLGRPGERPDPKKPTALRGVVGVWDCESSDRAKFSASTKGFHGSFEPFLTGRFLCSYESNKPKRPNGSGAKQK